MWKNVIAASKTSDEEQTSFQSNKGVVQIQSIAIKLWSKPSKVRIDYIVDENCGFSV